MRPLKSIVAALVLILGLSPAYADDEGDETNVADHADPEAGTLPSHASDTARANAFGQQGERMRAAHHAAREAAVAETRRAAREMAAGRPESPGRSAARAANSDAGRARAAEAAAAGRARADAARTAHPPRGPRS